ncbi:Phasin family protein [Klebsiella pneumoniae]|nr:Phasin family protein [Klebsiella pneumoniae]
MTITLQAVNELIASLESAGELSIREQKFLKLAKEFRICSASLDAAIKTGNVLADQNAQLAAENVALKESRNNLAEFIHEELDADYPLNMNLETHATDRIVAGIKADGVEEFAAKLRIPGDDQFFDALAKGLHLLLTTSPSSCARGPTNERPYP